MKTNLPVTANERLFAAGDALVSRTDTRGIITFANDAFVAACGFSREELIGSSHNIIRHPDVPPAVFAAMWRTLQSGLPWHGVVKNRCRNGDYYWVDARIVPVKKNGATIGYMSVRTCPSREDIARAEQAYAAARQAPQAAAARGDSLWQKHFSIRNGVTAGIVFVTLLMIAGGILGITGLRLSNSAMQSLYYDEMEPVQRIGRINFLMADNRAQIALALHHDPALRSNARLDHDISLHLATLERNRSEIEVLWDGYRRHITSDAERALAETYWQARNRYVGEGLLQARAALAGGDYRLAEAQLLHVVNPLYDEANRNVGKLLAHLSERAQGNFTRLARRNDTISAVAVAGIVLGSLALMLAGLHFFRATVVPLGKAVTALENIAEGNLSDRLDAVAYGEPGRVMAAVTVMQMHLKVMMNEIQQSSDSIREQCHNLNERMMNLAEHADEQHDRVYQTLDAIVESCSGLGALADDAESLMRAIGAGGAAADVPAADAPATDMRAADVPAGDVPAGDVAARAAELASAARLQAFAVEDVAAQLRQVATLIVDSRAEVQGAWNASQQLEKTAGELDKLVKYFE